MWGEGKDVEERVIIDKSYAIYYKFIEKAQHISLKHFWISIKY